MNDETMVSIAEVRAAYKTAVLKTEDKFYRPTLEAFLTELTKPPEPRLRGDCIVSLHGIVAYRRSFGDDKPDDEFVTFLPTDKAQEIVERALDVFSIDRSMYPTIMRSVIKQVTAYTQEDKE